MFGHQATNFYQENIDVIRQRVKLIKQIKLDKKYMVNLYILFYSSCNYKTCLRDERIHLLLIDSNERTAF